MIDLFLYFFWEASLFIMGLGVALWSLKGAPEDRSNGGVLITCALCIKLLVGAVIPQTAAFFGGSSLALLLSVAILSASLGVWLVSRSYLLRDTLFRNSVRISPDVVLAGMALIALAPAVAVSYMPLVETDSVTYGASIMKMMSGTLSPMQFSGHYVALWESTYIPNFLLSKTTYLFPFISLQASLLFACAAYTISRQLGLGALLATSLAVAGLLSGHFWGSIPSGAATLKNDTISAAGLLCFAAGVLRWADLRTFDRASTVLLSVGLSFGMTKSSGPVPLILATFVACLLWTEASKKIPRSLHSLLIIVAVAMVSSGLYYAHNWYTTGSPVFPFAIRLGPIAFDGPVDLSGTKLIDHVRSAEMWSYFFGLDTYYKNKAGLLFPGLFVFSLVLAPFISLLLGKTPDTKRQVLFLWVLSALAWYIYFGTPWSAGVTPQDFFYVSQQSSMRYALGAIQLSLILCAVSIEQLGRRTGKALALVLVWVEIVGRGVSHYGYTMLGSASSVYAQGEPVWEMAYWWIGLAVVCAGTMLLVKKNRVLIGTLAFFVFSIFLIPATFDANKKYWAKDMLAVDNLKGSGFSGGAYTLTTLGSKNSPVTALLISDALATTGSRFQFDYMGNVAIEDISNVLAKAPSSAVVARCNSGGKITAVDLIKIDSMLNPQGYSLVTSEACSAVFVKLDWVMLHSQKLPEVMPLLPSVPRCLLNNRYCGWPEENLSYFATELPPAIWHTGSNASELARVSVEPGTVIELKDPAVQGKQALFKYTGFGWQISKKGFKQMAADSKVPPLITNGQLNDAAWVISSPGTYKSWVQIEQGRPVLNIQSTEDTPWLALVLKGTATDDKPGMLYATVSSNMTLAANYEAFDFDKQDKVSHTSLPIHLEANKSASDWFGWNLGRERVKDYVALTATDLKLGQIIKISNVVTFSTPWPRSEFIGLSPNVIE